MNLGVCDPKNCARSRQNSSSTTTGTTLLCTDDMTDAEKIRSPGVIIGLVILVLPFIAGVVALNVYK